MRDTRTLSEAVDCMQPPPRAGLLPIIGEGHGEVVGEVVVEEVVEEAEEVVEEGGAGVLKKAGESPRRLAAQSKTTCSSSVHAGEQIHWWRVDAA